MAALKSKRISPDPAADRDGDRREFVIPATWVEIPQVVCVPQGMRVLSFGIGLIGATILAVELPAALAIRTASGSAGKRASW